MSDQPPLQPLLTVLSGPLQGAHFRLTDARWVIGRESGVDILIDDFKVSRRHAVLEVVDGRATLTDGGSTNGTWLNGGRVHGTEELRDGDRIRLGSVELRFYDPASALTDPVGAPFRAPGPRQLGAAVPRAVSGALGGPTEAIPTRRGPRRLLIVVGGLVLAAWVTWAYFILR
ncbi:FHA domain-containing protein [Micromonospora sp. NPDC049679]|uniref:FHA domain-containing protein n=1 Tax=Micromonospora sp. NPDC049679 TaxID=3155920 RepID=UPI0033D89B17